MFLKSFYKKTTKIFKARLSSENIFNQILNENPISILTVMIKKMFLKNLNILLIQNMR